MADGSEFQISEEIVTSPAATLAYAHLADDFNPLHIDPDFAATTVFGAAIAHGSHVLALAIDLLERSAPEGMILHESQVRFVAPIFVGTKVFLRISVNSDDPQVAAVTVDDGDGKRFLEGRASFKFLGDENDRLPTGQRDDGSASLPAGRR